MRLIFAPALLACLSACSNMTTDQQAKLTQVLTVICNVDGALVPVVQPIVATLGSAGAATSTADLLLHPAVVAACKTLSGTPASVTATSPAVAVSSDTATKPAN